MATLLQQGIQAHQKGNLVQAATLYQQVIQKEPTNPEGYYMLAVLLGSQGELEEALTLVLKALEINEKAEYHDTLGNIYLAQDKLNEALQAYHKALVLDPNLVQTLYNVGSLLHDVGQLDEALTFYDRAIKLAPSFIEAYFNRGSVYFSQNKFDAAQLDFEMALVLKPDMPQIYNNLGLIAHEHGDFDLAIAHYQKALALEPNYADAWNNKGTAHLRKADYAAAIESLDKALALDDTMVEAYVNRGVGENEQGNFIAAQGFFSQAIALEPSHVSAHWNRSHGYLMSGDWDNGWPEFEWRWKLQDYEKKRFNQPLWEGDTLEGTLLVHAEGGYGDTFQFIRFLPLVKAKCGKVILEVQQGLKSTLKNIAGADEIYERGDELPVAHQQISLMSLPYALRIKPQTLPNAVPYIHIRPEVVSRWADKLSIYPGKKVGLVWAGSATNRDGHYRSMPVTFFSALANTPGIHFFSLQKGPQAKELYTSPPEGIEIIDLAADLKDFEQTAATIQNLDVVISVDTAVAHLAGALAKPVILTLPFQCDWRWGHHQFSNMWYPGTHIIRQPTPGDWASVIQAAKALL